MSEGLGDGEGWENQIDADDLDASCSFDALAGSIADHSFDALVASMVVADPQFQNNPYAAFVDDSSDYC